MSPVIEPAMCQTWELLAAVFFCVEETGVQKEVGTTTERDTEARGAEKVLVTFTAAAEAALQTGKVFFLPEKPEVGLGSLAYGTVRPPRALSHPSQERPDQAAAAGRRKAGGGPSQAVPWASPDNGTGCTLFLLAETPPRYPHHPAGS